MQENYSTKVYDVGIHCDSRQKLCNIGIHRPTQAGIWGNQQYGAISVVISGGYEDDEDEGDTVIYTGSGGMENGVQTADQVLEKGNKYLHDNCMLKKPIRVTRGYGTHSKYAPVSGYRYDGLYTVEKAWPAQGKSGFIVWRYALKRVPGQPPLPPPIEHQVKKLKTGGWSAEKKTKRLKFSMKEELDPSPAPRFNHHVKSEPIAGPADRIAMNAMNEVAPSWEESSLAKAFACLYKGQRCFICEQTLTPDKISDHLSQHRKEIMKNLTFADQDVSFRIGFLF
eukprot:TRINITY_DN8904_c0_g1_i2.p1 TRINITY_DN8904_c0_g1~~TRINITY_DN8904_c0_g1_i2.p1  ORF type:complete len:282 (-),score=29.01 TRINITY_DN8904_c0_g1_i2:150-995(-)